MSLPPVSRPAFGVTSDDDYSCEVLVLGLSSPGLAGVTAADYLSRDRSCTEIGYVAPETLPSIAPFAEGVPRNHTRIYDVDETPLSLVVGELFVPVWAASSFVDALLEWAERATVEEIVVPYGVPFPHGPDEHAVFTVATEAYRERRFADDRDLDERFPGLRGGVLDGPVGELVSRSLNGRAPPTGALVTPSHPPGPDLEAALRLIDALEAIYEIDVEEEELRRQSEELRDYYSRLADRMTSLEEGASRDRGYPEDRSYM